MRVSIRADNEGELTVPAPIDIEEIRRAIEAAAAAVGAVTLPEVRYVFLSSGDPVGAWNVARCRTREGLSEIYEAVLYLATDNLLADPESMLGEPCSLAITRGVLVRMVLGVVRRVEHLGISNGRRVARVHIVPDLWSLSQISDCRIFQDKTTVQIVMEVLRSRELYIDRVDLQLDGDYLTREYCVQYRETDLAFVSRLLAEEGITYYFRHTLPRETLVLTDHDRTFPRVVTIAAGYVPVGGPGAVTDVLETARFFDWHHELRSTSVTVDDFDFTRPRYDLQRQRPAGPAGARPVYDYPSDFVLSGYSSPVFTEDNSDAQALFRIQALRATEAEGKGLTNVVGMTPGFVFDLVGHGRAELDRKYLITRVEHIGSAPEELLNDDGNISSGDDRYHNDIFCIAADVQFRPARVPPRPNIQSIQTAIVVGPPNEEIYTDEHGRIRVQFHWDRVGASNEHSTCWLRSMQAWAGAGWGFMFLPRIGMEVVVGFVEGNPDRPMVLGATYNGENRPPYPLPAEKTKSTIKSRSTPGGDGYNEIRFEDLKGREEVFMHAQRDHNEVVERNHTRYVGYDESITVGHDRSVWVKHDQAMSAEHDETVTVGNNRTVYVGANQVHQVFRNDTTVVVGDRMTDLGNVGKTVEAGDLPATGNETLVMRGNREVQVGGYEVVQVTGNRNDDVGGFQVKYTAGDHTQGVGGNYHLWGQQQIKVTTNGDVEVSSVKDMVLTSESKLTLRVGGSELTLEPDKITLSATAIELKAPTASLNLDTDAALMGVTVKLNV